MRTLNLVLFLLCSVMEVQVQAAETEAVVIEVRKTISMSKNDKVYKNYFINGGELLGLKKGTIVDVLRRLPLHDPIKNISIGDLRVKVGEIEIIHADTLLSVARLISQDSPENRPVLDYEAVMVGDRLDLASVRTPKKAVTVNVDSAGVPTELEGEKVALLSRSDKAKSLIKEGEQHLETLANLKMKTNTKSSASRQVASVANEKASEKATKKASPSKKPMLKKKK